MASERAWLAGVEGRQPEEVTILGRQRNAERLTLTPAPYLVETDDGEKLIVGADKLWAPVEPDFSTLVKDVLDLADIIADHETRLGTLEGATNGDGR